MKIYYLELYFIITSYGRHKTGKIYISYGQEFVTNLKKKINNGWASHVIKMLHLQIHV